MEHKLHLASAVSKNGGFSRPNMSNKGIISAKMGQILPVWHYPCVPGDKVSVRHAEFARFEPLLVPSYVDLTYRTMTVFVPYHQVFDGAESFFANQSRFKGMYNTLPVIPNSSFRDLFLDGDISTDVGASSSSFDFVSGSNGWKKFTPLGRYISKVLLLLGYDWFEGIDGSTTEKSLRFLPNSNALPLLSFAHAYNCYLSYSARYNTSQLSATLERIKRRNSATNPISKADLKIILTSILLTYEESFFSALWKDAYSSQDSNTDFNIRDLSQIGQISQGNQVFWTAGLGSSFDDMNAEQVRLAMRFDDYFRRSNYSGSKDVQQIYSRFGVKIDDYRTRYPYYLGDSAQVVRIGDVTATADSGAAVVGSYAGKAISDGGQSFDFSSNDYGMLFTFAWFAPRPVYYTGVDPEIMRLTPFDFYTPELDQGFASLIPRPLLNIHHVNAIGNALGFAPLYSEYLYARDYIVGDFTRFVGNEAWHFGRKPSDLGDATAQSDRLIYMPCSGTEFERIFNVADSNELDVDTIYINVHNDVHATRPMKDRSGKAELGDGPIDLPNMGSQIN